MSLECKQEHLELGVVYEQPYIWHLGQDMHTRLGVNLRETLNDSEISFSCMRRQSGCPFFIRFLKKLDVHGQIGYELVEARMRHRDQCLFEHEEKSFIKMRTHLEQLKPQIKRLIKERLPVYGIQNPKILLTAVAKDIGLDEGFIYEGLVGKYMRRRIKKKFDNIIAEIKRELLPVRKAKRKPKRKTLGEEVDDDQLSDFMGSPKKGRSGRKKRGLRNAGTYRSPERNKKISEQQEKKGEYVAPAEQERIFPSIQSSPKVKLEASP